MTEANFIDLQFGDYDAVGITDHAERQKLFKLIQVVKREMENAGLVAPATAALPTQPVTNAPSTANRGIAKAGLKTPRMISEFEDEVLFPEEELKRSLMPSPNTLTLPTSAPPPSSTPTPSVGTSIPKPSRIPAIANSASTQNSVPAYAPVANTPPVTSYAPPPSVIGDVSVPLPTVNENESKIRVCIRKRPLNTKEVKKGEKDCLDVSRVAQTVIVSEPK